MPPRLIFSSTPTRSHGLYPTRWCDPFELNTSDGHGWMLLDLPGAPCDVTHPGRRTMSQRLRKAEQCAAAGGKYGLLQAVLLSLDSQPATPAQWVRTAIALEACSRVLLPEAHEVPVQLDAARAAYQQLTAAEQQLWRQLQAARLQLLRNRVDKPGDMEGFDMDESYIANVLGGVTCDVTLLGHELMRMMLLMCRWDTVCLVVKRYSLVGDPATPASMQAAYSWALASYHQHGPHHPETVAALAATEAADPEAWVPQLLAGLAYPPPAMPPESVPGNRMEAVGYCYHFGRFWTPASSDPLERQLELLNHDYSSYSPGIKWLLRSREIPMPTTQQQRELAPVRRLVCGDVLGALESVREASAEALVTLMSGSTSAGGRPLEGRGVARLLRALVVTAAAKAILTMNLPQLAAAPRLWEMMSRQLGYGSFANMAVGLMGAAEYMVPSAIMMLKWYGRLDEDPAAAASLGFGDPQELAHLVQMGPYLCLAAARWKWQCGDAAAAYIDCNLEPGCFLHLLRDMLQMPDEEVKQSLMASGLLPTTTAAIDALVSFLSQQKALQRPGTGLQQLGQVCSTGQGPEAAAAAAAAIAQLGDPQVQRLYDLFPGWLDQLVSQVTGRDVSLVVEPAAAHSIDYTPHRSCKVYLMDAASGRQQLFGWRHPGDVDQLVAHKMLMQQAKDRGCPDSDLQLYCPAVEPYTGEQVARSRASRSSSSAAGAGMQQPSARSPAYVPGAARAGVAAARAGAVVQQQQQQQGAAEVQQFTASTAPPGGTENGAGSTSSATAARQGPVTGRSSSSGSSSRVKPSRPCAQCGELFPKLQQCSRCKAVAYCSRDCQVAHWRAGHKEACQGQPVT